MERIRCVVFGLLLVFGLLFSPSVAYASDGFMGGLEDLVGVRKVRDDESTYEDEFAREYEPVFRENSVSSVEVEEGQEIQSVINAANSVQWGANAEKMTLLGTVVYWFTYVGKYNSMFMLAAVGLVFLWWGVRKTKNMIMNGFRKGRITS